MNSTSTLEKKASVQNGILRMVFSVLILLLEAVFLILIFTELNHYAAWINIATRVIAVLAVLGIYSMHKTASIRMSWIIFIMAAPIVGLGVYLIVGLNTKPHKMRKRYRDIDDVLLPKLTEGSHGASASEAAAAMKEFDPQLAGISDYISRHAGYPIYADTDIEYYDDAAAGLAAQKAEMKKAQHFIFMEYHAIEDAESWHGIQQILEERVRAGVEVRVFYDDMGSIGFINKDFITRLEAVGIKCRVFNPFAPGLNIFLNNRDHRKITVIDGRVGFTGGYNLANEYFNLTHPYGLWKDTGVKITGPGVRSLTVTFLENWNAVKEGDQDDIHFEQYLPEFEYAKKEAGALVQPYADSPLDDVYVGEDVYMSLADKAVNYCWYITPYLILTDETISALTLAARRGVDVRVITPGIPDKKIVYACTRSYYNSLARHGVRIYEWTPGFCHCKMCVTDDKAAVCGTMNLDYRSLYHHFENACLYMNCRAVRKTREDFERIMAESTEVTEKYTTGREAYLRILQLLLRLISPLL